MGNRAIVVGTAVSTGGLVLITVILILIVVIIIVAVKYRQQNKLLNFNKTKKDGHRHIGLGKTNKAGCSLIPRLPDLWGRG